MKITDISVDGFGVWTGLELNTLSEGLNVFYGPNEAGKTTLMNFVRTIFFGFAPERVARYLPPIHGGQAGGALNLSSGEAAYLVTRHSDDRGHTSQLMISRGGRQAVDQAQALASLLGDVDEPTFNNVFVFGLSEIQELATLGDTRAAEELYGLALGLDRVSLVDVLNELNLSRDRLLTAADKPSLVSQLLGQRERLQCEIEELGHASIKFLALSSERDRLDAEIDSLEAEHNHWEEHSKRIALAGGLAERWQRRRELGAQLQTLSHADALPANGLERFEQIEAGLGLTARRIRRLKRKKRNLREQISDLKVNEAFRRHVLRIEALAEQQPWMSALQKQISEIENELFELESESEDTKKQWGATSGPGAALSKRAIDELRQAAAELHRARRDAQKLHEQSTSAEAEAETVRRRVDEALGNMKQRNLTEALSEAGELVSNLRKRVQIEERIGQMTARESELEEQGHENLENQMLPTWALAGLGSMFVIGCALVLLYLAAKLLPGTLGESFGWLIGVIGVGLAGAAAMMKFGMERNAEGRVDKCHQQLAVLSQQIKHAKEDRDELDELLPKGGGPLIARLQAAEKSLHRLEELLPLQSERDTVAGSVERVRKESEAVRDRCRDTRKRWLKLLSQNHLPADLSPAQLKSFARGRRQVAGLSTLISDKKSELGRRKIEFESLAARVTQLIAQVGIRPRSDKPLEQLAQCLSELAEQQTLIKQREDISKQIAKLKPRYLLLVRRRNKLRRQRSSLLRSAGTLDEVEFRRRAAMQSDALRLRGEFQQLEQEINLALGSSHDETVTDWLAQGENLLLLSTQADEASRLATQRLNEASERRGELNARLQLLSEDRQLTEKQLELTAVDKRLSDALFRWRVLAVCNLLLVSVREFYERERQPQVLRETSKYLKRLTGGRYTRVWTPFGQHALHVDDQNGQSLTVEVLSSGTREQLFLALRMALASSFARRGIELPLVLDDVLVNFDVTRAKAAALVLRDFAKQGHQVLVFTCHEHIAKLFRTIKAEVRNLPERNQAPEPPRQRRVREEPEPEPVVEEEEPVVELEPEPIVLEVEEPLPEPDPEPVMLELPVLELPEVEPEPPPVTPVAVAPRVELHPLVLNLRPMIFAPPMPIAIELAVAPAPAPTPAPTPPPAPLPKPVARKRRRRAVRQYERQRWSAEEFDGELADRVRDGWWVEEELEPEFAEAGDEAA